MINIEFVADSKFPVDRDKVRGALINTLSKHGISDNAEITVIIVGKRKMTKLNSEYMGRKGPTDVLSFPLNDPQDDTAFVSSPDDVLRLGDIVVCYSVAMEYALKRQKLIDDIVCELVEHGCLHLLGIHHD